MEAPKIKETPIEKSKETGKAFTDNTAAMLETYNKQLHLMTGLYTDFFNVMDVSKSWSMDKGFMGPFQNNNNFVKMSPNSFNNFSTGFQNPFLNPFEKIFAQMADQNRSLFSAFTGEVAGSSNWSEIGKKYKDTLDSRIEASKNTFKSTIEAYNKHLESSVETNKKMMEDINTEFSSVIEKTQQFWVDVLNINKARFTKENPTIKPFPSPESDKKAATPAVEIKNLKPQKTRSDLVN